MALAGYHSWLKAGPPQCSKLASSGVDDEDDVFFSLESTFSANRGILGPDRLDTRQVGQPISACRVACAPFGGLMAVWPEPHPASPQRVSPTAGLVITSPGGRHRAEILTKDLAAKPTESLGRLVGVGWLDPELLACVFQNGSGRIFSATGQRESSFTVGQTSGSADLLVSEVMFYSTGLVAVMVEPPGAPGPPPPPRLVHVHWPQGVPGHTPAAAWLAAVPLMAGGDGAPAESATCFALMPPLKGGSSSTLQQRPLQVVVGMSGGGLAVVSADDARTYFFTWVPTRIEVDGLGGDSFVAVLTDESEVHILSSDLLRDDCCVASCSLQRLYAGADPATAARPPAHISVRHMAWVGADGVALALDSSDADYDGRELRLRVLDASGRIVAADDGAEGEGLDVVALRAEVDACVVVGVEDWRLLRSVPAAVVKAVGPTGSTSPAAMLIQASQLHDASNSRCAVLLNDLQNAPGRPGAPEGRLSDAIRDCVAVATWLWDIGQQRALLRAAVFGKVYCPQVDNGLISAAAQQLRVLNTLHSASRAGRGLTSSQLQYLVLAGEAQYVPDVLSGMYDFYLAREIALGLELSEVPVMLAWARAKIAVHGSAGPEACLRALEQKLSKVAAIPWASVAASATELGYRDLGAKLLAKDPQDGHVVPLLIDLDVDEALAKALNTCSEDLTLLVLLSKFSEAPDAFYRFLAERAAAGVASPFDLWHSFALSHDVPMPDVKARWKSEVLGNHALLCAVTCNAPAHAATSALQEVLNSTAGPAQAGLPPGAQKGRGDAPGEWEAQQRLLDEARKQFDALAAQAKLREAAAATARGAGGAGVAPQPPPLRVERGLYSLADAKWQAAATHKFWALRQRQFKYEKELGISLVGLSVDATLEKLLDKGHKEEFNSTLKTFVGPAERERKVFTMQVQHLAAKKRFPELLVIAERQRTDWHVKMIVHACIAHDAHKAPGNPALEGGIMERLGGLASRMSDARERQQLLEFLREKNVQVVDVPQSMMSNLQRVSGPMLNAAQDVASSLSQAAQTGMGAAANSVMTGIQSIRKQR